MCIKPSPPLPNRGAFTFIELLVSAAVGMLAISALLGGLTTCGRSLLRISSATDLNRQGQIALDRMSQEIRTMHSLVSIGFTTLPSAGSEAPVVITNQITLSPRAGSDPTELVIYEYIPQTKRLLRCVGNSRSVLLENCEYVNFSTYQRTQSAGAFGPAPTSDPERTKIIRVRWLLRQEHFKGTQTSESSESAYVVIRAK